MPINNDSRVGSRSHDIDLSTPEGEATFKADVEDGKLDGKDRTAKAGFSGVTYDDDQNLLHVGKRTYDLNDADQIEVFKQDAADGALDGYVGKPPRKEVEYNQQLHDVSTKQGREKFAEAFVNGVENIGFSYDRDTNRVSDGTTTYDLDNPAQRRLFDLDARDGRLDGRRTHQDLARFDAQGNTGSPDDDFDLSTPAGREWFARSLKENNGILRTDLLQASYDAKSNSITLSDGEQVTKKYNLNDPADRAAYRKDAADGILDGKADRQDLKHVRLFTTNHDLTTPDGRQAFADLLNDPSMVTQDGLGFNPNGLTYDQSSNTIKGPDGKTVYDLSKPDGLANFSRDISDRYLDGDVKTNARLEDVRIGKTTYNLNTEQGRKDFEADVRDGRLDGKAGKTKGEWKGVSYDPINQSVTAGDRVYNLNDPKDYHDFRRDAADGKLGGEARMPVIDRGPIRC